jgi:hypothetical protein
VLYRIHSCCSFMCLLCRLLFVLCPFSFGHCVVFFFNIRIMITSLVSSNSSYLRYLKSQQKRNFDKIFSLFKGTNNNLQSRHIKLKISNFSFNIRFTESLHANTFSFHWFDFSIFSAESKGYVTPTSNSSYLRYLKSQQKGNFDKILYLFKESDVLFVWVLFKTNTMGLVMGTSSVSSTDVIAPWWKHLS